MSRLTLRDITSHTTAVFVTSGGPAAPQEATTAVTFAEMPDFLPIAAADVHHRCRGRWSGTNKTCPSDGRWGNIGISCVHLDYLLIATVGTLITFVCQVIGAPLLQSDGHPNTFQPTICLSLQSQPSTYVTYAGSCRIPNINLQRYP